MKCPCGSSMAFADCCQPIITGTKCASTAEQLMRSRYSAYATNIAEYLVKTYATNAINQPSIVEIADWANQCQWLELKIHPQVTPVDDVVEFSAYYLQGKQYIELREKSRFIVEQGEWRYLDGDILRHQALSKLKRNDNCPCQSNKKFKLCCGRRAF